MSADSEAHPLSCPYCRGHNTAIGKTPMTIRCRHCGQFLYVRTPWQVDRSD